MHAPSRLRPLFALAAVSLAVLGLAACGDDDNKTASGDTSTTVPSDGYGATSSTAKESGDAAATVVAKDFSLTSITVTSGKDVYFSNEGSAPHTMTSDDGTSFDTGTIQGGGDTEFKAPAPGTYAFHCEIHPAKMKGTLTVE
jgi:plastocyanin